jgi:hypothetical protein
MPLVVEGFAQNREQAGRKDGAVRTIRIVLCCVAWVSAAIAAEGQSPKLVEAILSAIREPKPGQFPTPESAVRFLLEQVKKQDIDEVARVFPIRECLERMTFPVHAKLMMAYQPVTSPRPGAAFHNLCQAMMPLTTTYHQLTLALLGVEPAMTQHFPDEAAVAKFHERLDPARLKDIEIKSVRLDGEFERHSAGQVIPANKVLGVEALQVVRAVVRFAGADFTSSFFVGRIGGQWRVLGLSEPLEPVSLDREAPE